MSSLDRGVEWICEKASLVCGAMLIVSAMYVSVDLVARKLLNLSLVGANEISGYVLGISTAWAFSYALLKRSHIRIDVFYRYLPSRWQAAIDIMADIAAFFSRSLAIADRAGIARDKIVLDPGIGFGKTPEQSIVALARMDALKSFGLPILIGASRKRFIDSVSPAPPDRRIGGSIASHLIAAASGAAIVRVHDVAETVQALRVAAAIERAR